MTNTWAAQSGCQSNPQLQAQTTTLNDTNQVSQVTFGYDAYNNVTDQTEYDWGTGAPGAPLRETTTVYLWQAAPEYAQSSVNLVRLPFYTIWYDWYDSSRPERARTVYYYDQTLTQTEATAIVNHDDTNFGTGYNRRGNLTSLLRSLNPGATAYVNTQMTYDVAGNVLTVNDANHHRTTLAYATQTTPMPM